MARAAATLTNQTKDMKKNEIKEESWQQIPEEMEKTRAIEGGDKEITEEEEIDVKDQDKDIIDCKRCREKRSDCSKEVILISGADPSGPNGPDSAGGSDGSDSAGGSDGKWMLYAIAAGATGAVVLAPVALGAVGFTSAGIAAGSIAAKMMSAAAIANGGGVAAGSLVAVLQTAGAAGLSGTATAVVGSAGGAVGWLTSRVFLRHKKQDNKKSL